jgi:hypothetical protein
MITAHEAMLLVRQSEEHIKKQVEDLDSPIRQAAQRGQRSIDVPTNYVGGGVNSFSHPYWRPLDKALRDLGFCVHSVQRESSPGLGSMGDEPTVYEAVVVSW